MSLVAHTKNGRCSYGPFFSCLLCRQLSCTKPREKGEGGTPDLHVELSHKTRKVVVFEMLGQDIPRELHDVADNERRSCVVPGN